MKLFELDDTYTVNFNPEIFLIEDFRKLRDSRKKNIELIYKELGFIFFFCDLKSDFQFQTNKVLREEDVKKQVGLDEKWKPDDLVLACMKTYKYLSQTVSSRLLESIYITVDKIKFQLEGIDLNERHPTTNVPIWNIKQISDTAKSFPSLMESIRQAEKEYIKGQEENEKLRGDKIKTLYEDGITK